MSRRRASLTVTAKLLEAEVPVWGEYLMAYWRDLSSGRGSTGWGPAPLSWVDIGAWCSLRRIQLDSFEVEVIRRLDQAWLQSLREAQ